MKALTLTQPWATLIAIGAKRIETRSWGTNFRGRIAIHAAKGLGPVGGKQGFQEQCALPPFNSVLVKHLEDIGAMKSARIAGDVIPLGAIVATARLIDCRSTNDPTWINKLSLQERRFGNYEVRRYGWFLEDVGPLSEPIYCKGALSLWEVPPEIEGQLRMQLEGVTELDVAETHSPTLWPA